MRSKQTNTNPASIAVPPGHALLMGDRSRGGAPNGAPRIVDLATGRVMLADGSLAPRDEQLTPADSSYDADLHAQLSDYAYQTQLATWGRRRGLRSFAAPHSFRALNSDRDHGSTGVVPVGERTVLMDLGQADVHIDSAMPNYAAGYRLDESVADVVAPPLVVAKSSNYYQTWDDVTSFRRVIPNGASAGGATPEISISKTSALYATKSYALGGFMPTEVEANADAPLRPYQKLVRRVMEALYLEREIRVATLLTTSGNWSSGQVITLTSGTKWNGGASADPVRNLLQICETSAARVTGIIMPTHVYNQFATSTAVQKYIAYKSSAGPIPNMAEISALLRLPRIYEAPMKYYASGSTFSYVWGGDVVLFRESPELPPVSQDDVTTAATFRWLGGDAPDGTQQAGWLVRTFFLQDRGPRGGRKVVVAHNDDEKITSNITGGLIKGAVQ